MCAHEQKVRLQDRDKATTDAWFFGVYAAITEFARLPIPASEDHAHKFSAVLSASLLDESTSEQVRCRTTEAAWTWMMGDMMGPTSADD